MIALTPDMLLQLALLVLIAPLFRGATELVSMRLDGRRGPAVGARYGELIALFTQRGGRDQKAGFLYDFAPPLALAVIVAGVLLLPVIARDNVTDSTSAAFTLIALIAVARVVTGFGAIAEGGITGRMGAVRELGERALLEPAVLLAAVAAIQASRGYGAGGAVYLAFVLAASGSAVAIWTLVRADERGPGASSGRSALVAQYSGPHRGLLELAADLRDVLLWSVWLALFLPTTEGNLGPLPAPFVAAGVLAGKLMLVAILSAFAQQQVSSRTRFALDRLPATALGLAAGAFLLTFLGGSFT